MLSLVEAEGKEEEVEEEDVVEKEVEVGVSLVPNFQDCGHKILFVVELPL